jgi:hypothetical protein
MVRDFERINEFRLLRNPLYEPFPPDPTWGVLIATTWSKAYATWWKDSDMQFPGQARDEGWERLRTKLEGCERCSSVPLAENEGNDEAHRSQFALWAIWPIARRSR